MQSSHYPQTIRTEIEASLRNSGQGVRRKFFKTILLKMQLKGQKCVECKHDILEQSAKGEPIWFDQTMGTFYCVHCPGSIEERYKQDVHNKMAAYKLSDLSEEIQRLCRDNIDRMHQLIEMTLDETTLFLLYPTADGKHGFEHQFQSTGNFLLPPISMEHWLQFVSCYRIYSKTNRETSDLEAIIKEVIEGGLLGRDSSGQTSLQFAIVVPFRYFTNVPKAKKPIYMLLMYHEGTTGAYERLEPFMNGVYREMHPNFLRSKRMHMSDFFPGSFLEKDKIGQISRQYDVRGASPLVPRVVQAPSVRPPPFAPSRGSGGFNQYDFMGEGSASPILAREEGQLDERKDPITGGQPSDNEMYQGDQGASFASVLSEEYEKIISEENRVLEGVRTELKKAQVHLEDTVIERAFYKQFFKVRVDSSSTLSGPQYFYLNGMSRVLPETLKGKICCSAIRDHVTKKMYSYPFQKANNLNRAIWFIAKDSDVQLSMTSLAQNQSSKLREVPVIANVENVDNQ